MITATVGTAATATLRLAIGDVLVVVGRNDIFLTAWTAATTGHNVTYFHAGRSGVAVAGAFFRIADAAAVNHGRLLGKGFCQYTYP